MTAPIWTPAPASGLDAAIVDVIVELEIDTSVIPIGLCVVVEADTTSDATVVWVVLLGTNVVVSPTTTPHCAFLIRVPTGVAN